MGVLLQFVPYWAFYVRHPSASGLVLTSPPHIIPFLVVTVAVWRWAFRGIIGNLRKGSATPGGVALLALIFILSIAMTTPNASVTLDRASGTMTIRRFFIFWVPYVKRIPLVEVTEAGTQEAPFSTLFYLETVNGERYHLSSWDAASGQGKGADAVNRFLEETPGTPLYQKAQQ